MVRIRGYAGQQETVKDYLTDSWIFSTRKGATNPINAIGDIASKIKGQEEFIDPN
jgi:hypothetical protein